MGNAFVGEICHIDLDVEYEKLNYFAAFLNISIFPKSLSNEEADKEIVFYQLTRDQPDLLTTYLSREARFKDLYDKLYENSPFLLDGSTCQPLRSRDVYMKMVEESLREENFISLIFEDLGWVVSGTHDLEVVVLLKDVSSLDALKNIAKSCGLYLRDLVLKC